MEQAQQEKVYMERLPLVAMQIRSALGNIYYGMQKLAPADERDEDPILDANAAMLYHGYFRLLRLAKNLESASMLNRKELLPTENTDLKVWLDEIIREAEGRRGTVGTRPCLLWRSSPDSFPHFPESMRRR